MAVRRRTVVLGERKAASSCRLQSGRLAGEPGGIETLLSNEGSAEPKGKHPPILIAKLSAVHAGGELAGHELKSLQVTSSVISEGKSFVAANLAVTLAKYSGSKTLLIEGDLHRPTLATMFGLKDLHGLSDWWTARNQELACYIKRFTGTALSFLPAGKACDRPSEILRSGQLADAFAQLRSQFDWIVVDSTPMLPVIDANLWSRLVDGSLLVVREGVAPLKALKKGLQSLDNPKLIGVVVNEASDFDQIEYEGQYYGARKNGDKGLRKAQ